MARWSRALGLLPPAPARVLDCGCAFGFLTRRLARRYGAAAVCAIDLDGDYVARARRAVPGADIRCGPADTLPWPDASFDAAVCLEVLEHVHDAEAVVAELARVLRPDGTLVVSVPHAGLLAAADSLNVYARLLPGRTAPTDDPSWSLRPHHRHFSLAELRALLEPAFAVDIVSRTGSGVAELVHLPLLVLTRGISPRLRGLYRALQYLYFAVYALDDSLPTGRWGYSITVRARRAQTDDPQFSVSSDRNSASVRSQLSCAASALYTSGRASLKKA